LHVLLLFFVVFFHSRALPDVSDLEYGTYTLHIDFHNLAKNFSAATIPTSWSQLSFLTYLNLASCSLQGNLSIIQNLHSLESLKLYRNEFTSKNFDFSKLVLLTELNILRNRYLGSTYTSFFSVASLHYSHLLSIPF